MFIFQIWLKDAFQCRGCAMTCHKKCVSKCLTLSACGRRASVQPEIITTVVDDQQPEQPEPKPDQVCIFCAIVCKPLALRLLTDCRVKM